MAHEPLRLEALWVKKETSYGVDATPVGTDAVRLTGSRLWEITEVEDVFENFRDDVMNNSLTPPKPGIPRGRVCNINGAWEMKGKGSAYAASTDIEADPLLQACGLSVEVDATPGSEKLTYTPADTGHASACGYGYTGGIRHKPLGMRGSLIWTVQPGRLGTMEFNMRGLLETAPDTQAVPASTFDSGSPPAGVGCALVLTAGGAYTPERVQEMKLDLGNQIETVEDAQATDGLQGIEIPERKPRFSVVVGKEALATYDPVALRRAVTSHTIALTLGQAQYNRCKLSATESYLVRNPEPVNYQGFAGWRLTFGLVAWTLVWD